MPSAPMNDNTEKPTMAVTATSGTIQEVLSTEKSSLGWKIFSAFINGTEMEATEEELMNYAVKDLKVDLSQLPPIFVENLPLILVAFMNTWSGWLYKAEYFAGIVERQHYFNRFHSYMICKGKMLNNSSIVGSILRSICPEDSYNYKTGMKSHGKSIELNKTNKEFLPFAISIQCPAYLMNTLVFSNMQDDIIMKQHMGNAWQDLSTMQLVNWPNIDVVFRTPDLCFIRKQATHYLRYLNYLPYETKHSSEKNIIERIEHLNTYGRATMCYTYRLLRAYVQEYMLALKTVKNITGSKLEEIQTILGEFLADIKQININNSMASDTVILFRLSQVPFVRNKKLVKNSEHNNEEIKVGYCEIITPKVELLLVYFRAVQKQTPSISFEYPDRIKANVNDDIRRLLPNICYKCSFCKVDFNGPCAKEKMLNHLKIDHKMEQPVRCAQCKKQFGLLSLTACRWRHKCTNENSKVL